MKKICLLLLLLVVGCSKETKCYLTVDNEYDNYLRNVTYIIHSDNQYVKTISIEENITSNDKSMIQYFKSYNDVLYENYSNIYGGYEYKITSNNKKVSITASIDYSKVDMDIYKENNSSYSGYFNKGRISTKGMKKMLEDKGYTCK